MTMNQRRIGFLLSFASLSVVSSLLVEEGRYGWAAFFALWSIQAGITAAILTAVWIEENHDEQDKDDGDPP